MQTKMLFSSSDQLLKRDFWTAERRFRWNIFLTGLFVLEWPEGSDKSQISKVHGWHELREEASCWSASGRNGLHERMLIDSILSKHSINEDLFPTGQHSSVNAVPKLSTSLLTAVSVLPKMTESHNDASTVILQVRPLIANKIHSSVNVLWKTWNA